jgi:hypothetical protein
VADKPATLPEWCSDEANLTEPAAGQKATGWTEDQIGVSSYENWRANLVWQWTAYLRDGVFTGDHSINGLLDVTGDVGVGGLLEVTGNGAFGSAYVDADLTVNGEILNNHASRLVPLSLLDGYQNTGSNAARATSGGIPTGGIDFTTPVTGNDWIIPISGAAMEGERILAVSVRLNENLSGGNGRLTVQLYRAEASGGAPTQIATQNSSGSGNQTVTATCGTPEIVEDAVTGLRNYFARVLVDGDTGVSQIFTAGLVVDGGTY